MTQLRGDPRRRSSRRSCCSPAPGTPFLYYGEEIGMTGTQAGRADPDADALDRRTRRPRASRTGEPWQALSDDDPATVNVEAQAADRDSLLAAYGDLVRVRGAAAGPAGGATTIVDSDAEPVIGWLRTTADATVLALVNVSDQPVDAYSLTLADGPLCGPQAATLLGAVNGDAGAAGHGPRRSTPAAASTPGRPSRGCRPASGFLVAWRPRRERPARRPHHPGRGHPSRRRRCPGPGSPSAEGRQPVGPPERAARPAAAAPARRWSSWRPRCSSCPA